MVLTFSRRSTNNKENALMRAPFHVKRSNEKTPSKRNRSSLSSLSSTHSQRAAADLVLPPLQPSFGKRAAAARALDTCLHSFMKEQEEDTVTTSKSSGRKLLSLPRRLQRPFYRPISPQALSAIDPDLADVPVEYLRRKVFVFGELLYAMTTRINPRYTGGRILPKELEIVASDDIVPAGMPTHIAVVYAQVSPSSNKRVVSLYPVHALVLATQCAHIPPSSYSLQPTKDKSDSTQTLPVLPLRIPSPRTFPLLLHYLYTHRIKTILSALIPVFPSSQDNNMSPPSQELSLKLSRACPATALLSLVATVYELWANIAALGIFDENLWQAVEYSWTVVLAALEMKTSKPMAAAAIASAAPTS